MGRVRDLYYTKNKIAEELDISRETLNSLEKEEADLATFLKTGLILKLEAKKGEEIPFIALSLFFKDKKKIKEIKKFPLSKFYFLKRKEEIIDFGFAFHKQFGLTDVELNLFIEERNLYRIKKEKIQEEFSIFKEIKKIEKELKRG